MRYRILLAALAAAVTTTGCIGFEHKNSVTGPSGSGMHALGGNWTSANIIPSPSTCTDFKWFVTQHSETSASGSFTAVCANELQVSGTAQGTLSGSVINWSANGNATAPGLPSCAIALTGTAELLVDGIRIPYAGQTCVGAVSGVEVLRRR